MSDPSIPPGHLDHEGCPRIGLAACSVRHPPAPLPLREPIAAPTRANGPRTDESRSSSGTLEPIEPAIRRVPPHSEPVPESFVIHVHGNTTGLKSSQVKALERLGRRRLSEDRVITNDLARELTSLSNDIRRQVGVLLDRTGNVQHVMLGSQSGTELPDWGRLRAGRGRLRGLRLVHTHLAAEGLTRDDETDLALLRLDAVVSIEVGEDGLPGLAHAASLCAANDEGRSIEKLPPCHPADFDFDFSLWIRDLENELAQSTSTRDTEAGERAILVSVTAGRDRETLEMHVEELRELARAAGVQVVDVVTQSRPKVDPRTVLGSGKLSDLVIRCFQSNIDLVIFDQDMAPAQARNLSERMELRVIDRTQLILDIFAQRASTGDGKLQVELAQLRYRLPRLAQRADLSLSRLAGGIGGRGPGETKLESDRRRVRDRITRLERETKRLTKQREGRRRRRDRRNVPVLSIVGYTNAGKSTLLRALTQSDVHIEDKMFATLDPVSRRLRFPREREVIITDTVGFIRDLPEDLIAAFHATLEELRDASLLFHVVDAASPDMDRRIKAVREVLGELGLDQKPELLVFNQIDRLPEAEIEALARRYQAIPISALEGRGLRELLTHAEDILWDDDAHHPGEKNGFVDLAARSG
ncbi:MAG: GTPase HflX [bacterium]|nr:GTPase HflX [bacterium]